MDDATPGLSRRDKTKWAAENEAMLCAWHPTNQGVTRAWNTGLNIAFYNGVDYVVTGNSDLVFSPGWDVGMLDALEQADFVGPVSNAPGIGVPLQQVGRYLGGNVASDSDADITKAADALRDQDAVPLEVSPQPLSYLNGFCLMAAAETWRTYAYGDTSVFNPGARYRMTESEIELQMRAAEQGATFAIAPSSFVFHYRAITRGDAYLCEGAYHQEVADGSVSR